MKAIRSSRAGYKAFSLVEMVTSLSIISIIVLATGSAIIVVARAMPDKNSRSTQILRGAAFRDQLEAELRSALTVTELGNTAITFSIPDRNNDGVNEIIRYFWSGSKGAPLQMTYNGASPVNVLEDVHNFSLVYDCLRQLKPTTYTEGPEFLINTATASNLQFEKIENNVGIAQHIAPELPQGTEFWRITRIRARMMIHGNIDGITRILIRGATALNAPNGTIYDRTDVYESELSTETTILEGVAYKEVVFTGNPKLPPTGGVCLAFQWTRGAHSCDVIYRTNTIAGGVSRSSDDGSTWGVPTLVQQIPLQVYARASVRDPNAYQYLLRSVRLTLQTGGNGQLTQATIAPVSQPEVNVP